MTFNQHIYAIQNIINKGVNSDDKRISNRLVGHTLKVQRSLLIKRKLDKERRVNPYNYQRICVPMEEVQYADCLGCDLPVLDCTIYRSTIPIPASIQSR
jgi:hypothetical protein